MIRPGWAVFLGTAGDHVPHRHHAVQVALGTQSNVELLDQGGGRISAPGLVIPADRPHQLAPGPAPLLLIYLERESELGRSLDEWCRSIVRPLAEDQVRSLTALMGNPEVVTPSMLHEAVGLVLTTAQPPQHRTFSDRRITQAIADLPRPLPKTLAAAFLARHVGLSTSRFAHLFRAHTGMPLRPYLRWLRLQQALVEVSQGATLTDAAYQAGFADSAHLSRTFRKTFGIAPQVLLDPAIRLRSTRRP